MLRDNLVELIEPMHNSAGTDLLALGTYQQKPASDDSLSCLENPRPEGAESSLTDNVTSPFPAEPKQYSTKIVTFAKNGFWGTLHEARTDVSMLLGLIFLLLVGGGYATRSRCLACFQKA